MLIVHHVKNGNTVYRTIVALYFILKIYGKNIHTELIQNTDFSIFYS